jgi:glycosyltransferase involved in cell wall biosynthesis
LASLTPWAPDVVYERYSLLNLAGLAIARKLGVPHLLEVNAPLRLERRRTIGLAFERVATFVERQLFARTDAIFTVSTTLGGYVLSRGASPEKVIVAANGVDVGHFRPGVGRDEVRSALGFDARHFVIGFAGSLKPWHGVDTLLDAFEMLRATNNARLLIVGDGPCGEELRRRVHGMGLNHDVTFTGAVTHAAMPGILAAMDVGVAPYQTVPDFYFSPLKIYEYMAAGLPVVASDAAEIRTVIDEGVSGFLCRPEDVAALAFRLLALASDPDLATRLGSAARTKAEQHTWSANARIIAHVASSLSRTRQKTGTILQAMT